MKDHAGVIAVGHDPLKANSDSLIAIIQFVQLESVDCLISVDVLLVYLECGILVAELVLYVPPLILLPEGMRQVY